MALDSQKGLGSWDEELLLSGCDDGMDRTPAEDKNDSVLNANS